MCATLKSFSKHPTSRWELSELCAESGSVVIFLYPVISKLTRELRCAVEEVSGGTAGGWM